MKIAILTILFLIGGASYGQTMSPIVTESKVKRGKVTRGSFTISNNGVTPLPVIIEPGTLALDAKGPHYLPLASTTHLELSQTSVRLSPREQRVIDYRVKCDVLPCAVYIMANFAAGKNLQGLAVRIGIPTIVYLSEHEHARAEAIELAGLKN